MQLSNQLSHFWASWCLIMRSLRTHNIWCYWHQTCTYSILDLHNDLHECFDWRVNNDLSFSRFLTLDQGWRTLVLKSRSPAEFSSNPNKNSPACSFLVTLQTFIRFFKCVWLGLKQKSAGLWLSRTNVRHPCTRPFDGFRRCVSKYSTLVFFWSMKCDHMEKRCIKIIQNCI